MNNIQFFIFNNIISNILIMLRTILIVFFAINAVFWSLFPHNIHCDVANMVTNVCPAHSIHLTIGLVSFMIAFIISQYNYLKTIF